MTGVLAIAISLLVVVAYAVTTRTLTSQLDATLAAEADAYSAAMQGAPSDSALGDATRAYLTGRVNEGSGREVLLLVAFDRPQGGRRVISNSDLRIEDAADNTAIKAPPSATRFSDVHFNGRTYRVVSVPVLSQSTPVGVFQAAAAADVVTTTARSVALTLAAAGLIALAVGLPLSYLATRRALSPLTHMAAAATEISHARLGKRIDYDGPKDELGQLADALNEMLGRLENAFDDQRRFVADASHELRTPVAVIRGNVELLRTGHSSGADADESLEMIENESVRMGRLLDELLALARLESGGTTRFQPLQVRALVDEVAARGRALGERTITSQGLCEAWIDGDPDLLDQALVNLVKNAVAHTEEGGRIELACSADERTARISITDDGPGIPEADLARVFDRFYRAQGSARDDGTGGAGLGLAITRRLVELHGGAIHAENVEPHGARFVVELPRIAEPV